MSNFLVLNRQPPGGVQFLPQVHPDSTVPIHNFMPWQGDGGGAGIDLPQRSEIAPVTRAEETSIDDIYQTTQMGTFQTDRPHVLDGSDEGHLVFRVRENTVRRKSVNGSNWNPPLGRKAGGGGPHIFENPGQGTAENSQAAEEYSFKQKFPPISLNGRPPRCFRKIRVLSLPKTRFLPGKFFR